MNGKLEEAPRGATIEVDEREARLPRLSDTQVSSIELSTLDPEDGLSRRDRLVRRFAPQLEQLPVPAALDGLTVESVAEANRFYARPALKEMPAAFFIPPLAAPKVTEQVLHPLKDGAIVDLSFRSGYEPQHPSFKGRHEAVDENLTVHARMWRHDHEPRATIVAIHGWNMGDHRVNALAFQAGGFYQLNFDIALVQLPFHGRRLPPYLGESALFPSADLIRTNETMGQTISDLRELALHLRENGRSEIGVMGMSLGGYAAALWSSLDRLSFTIPIVPLVSMGEIAWSLLKRSTVFDALRGEGLLRRHLTEALSVHSPLSHEPPFEARERSLLLAGIQDRLIPGSQIMKLHQHWGEPALKRLSGGHAALLRDPQAFNHSVNFISRFV